MLFGLHRHVQMLLALILAWSGNLAASGTGDGTAPISPAPAQWATMDTVEIMKLTQSTRTQHWLNTLQAAAFTLEDVVQLSPVNYCALARCVCPHNEAVANTPCCRLARPTALEQIDAGDAEVLPDIMAYYAIFCTADLNAGTTADHSLSKDSFIGMRGHLGQKSVAFYSVDSPKLSRLNDHLLLLTYQIADEWSTPLKTAYQLGDAVQIFISNGPAQQPSWMNGTIHGLSSHPDEEYLVEYSSWKDMTTETMNLSAANIRKSDRSADLWRLRFTTFHVTGSGVGVTISPLAQKEYVVGYDRLEQLNVKPALSPNEQRQTSSTTGKCSDLGNSGSDTLFSSLHHRCSATQCVAGPYDVMYTGVTGVDPNTDVVSRIVHIYPVKFDEHMQNRICNGSTFYVELGKLQLLDCAFAVATNSSCGTYFSHTSITQPGGLSCICGKLGSDNENCEYTAVSPGWTTYHLTDDKDYVETFDIEDKLIAYEKKEKGNKSTHTCSGLSSDGSGQASDYTMHNQQFCCDSTTLCIGKPFNYTECLLDVGTPDCPYFTAERREAYNAYNTKVGRSSCGAFVTDTLYTGAGYADEQSVQDTCSALHCSYYVWSNDTQESYGSAWFCRLDHYDAVSNSDQWPEWKVGRPDKQAIPTSTDDTCYVTDYARYQCLAKAFQMNHTNIPLASIDFGQPIESVAVSVGGGPNDVVGADPFWLIFYVVDEGGMTGKQKNSHVLAAAHVQRKDNVFSWGSNFDKFNDEQQYYSGSISIKHLQAVAMAPGQALLLAEIYRNGSNPISDTVLIGARSSVAARRVYNSKVGRAGCAADDSLGSSDSLTTESSVQSKCEELQCAFYIWSTESHSAWFCKSDLYDLVANAAQFPTWKVGRYVTTATEATVEYGIPFVLRRDTNPPRDYDDWAKCGGHTIMAPTSQDAIVGFKDRETCTQMSQGVVAVLYDSNTLNVSLNPMQVAPAKWFTVDAQEDEDKNEKLIGLQPVTCRHEDLQGTPYVRNMPYSKLGSAVRVMSDGKVYTATVELAICDAGQTVGISTPKPLSLLTTRRLYGGQGEDFPEFCEKMDSTTFGSWRATCQGASDATTVASNFGKLKFAESTAAPCSFNRCYLKGDFTGYVPSPITCLRIAQSTPVGAGQCPVFCMNGWAAKWTQGEATGNTPLSTWTDYSSSGLSISPNFPVSNTCESDNFNFMMKGCEPVIPMRQTHNRLPVSESLAEPFRIDTATSAPTAVSAVQAGQLGVVSMSFKKLAQSEEIGSPVHIQAFTLPDPPKKIVKSGTIRSNCTALYRDGAKGRNSTQPKLISLGGGMVLHLCKHMSCTANEDTDNGTPCSAHILAETVKVVDNGFDSPPTLSFLERGVLDEVQQGDDVPGTIPMNFDATVLTRRGTSHRVVLLYTKSLKSGKLIRCPSVAASASRRLHGDLESHQGSARSSIGDRGSGHYGDSSPTAGGSAPRKLSNFTGLCQSIANNGIATGDPTLFCDELEYGLYATVINVSVHAVDFTEPTLLTKFPDIMHVSATTVANDAVIIAITGGRNATVGASSSNSKPYMKVIAFHPDTKQVQEVPYGKQPHLPKDNLGKHMPDSITNFSNCTGDHVLKLEPSMTFTLQATINFDVSLLTDKSGHTFMIADWGNTSLPGGGLMLLARLGPEVEGIWEELEDDGESGLCYDEPTGSNFLGFELNSSIGDCMRSCSANSACGAILHLSSGGCSGCSNCCFFYKSGITKAVDTAKSNLGNEWDTSQQMGTFGCWKHRKNARSLEIGLFAGVVNGSELRTDNYLSQFWTTVTTYAADDFIGSPRQVAVTFDAGRLTEVLFDGQNLTIDHASSLHQTLFELGSMGSGEQPFCIGGTPRGVTVLYDAQQSPYPISAFQGSVSDAKAWPYAKTALETRYELSYDTVNGKVPEFQDARIFALNHSLAAMTFLQAGMHSGDASTIAYADYPQLRLALIDIASFENDALEISWRSTQWDTPVWSMDSSSLTDVFGSKGPDHFLDASLVANASETWSILLSYIDESGSAGGQLAGMYKFNRIDINAGNNSGDYEVSVTNKALLSSSSLGGYNLSASEMAEGLNAGGVTFTGCPTPELQLAFVGNRAIVTLTASGRSNSRNVDALMYQAFMMEHCAFQSPPCPLLKASKIRHSPDFDVANGTVDFDIKWYAPSSFDPTVGLGYHICSGPSASSPTSACGGCFKPGSDFRYLTSTNISTKHVTQLTLRYNGSMDPYIIVCPYTADGGLGSAEFAAVMDNTRHSCTLGKPCTISINAASKWSRVKMVSRQFSDPKTLNPDNIVDSWQNNFVDGDGTWCKTQAKQGFEPEGDTEFSVETCFDDVDGWKRCTFSLRIGVENPGYYGVCLSPVASADTEKKTDEEVSLPISEINRPNQFRLREIDANGTEVSYIAAGVPVTIPIGAMDTNIEECCNGSLSCAGPYSAWTFAGVLSMYGPGKNNFYDFPCDTCGYPPELHTIAVRGQPLSFELLGLYAQHLPASRVRLQSSSCPLPPGSVTAPGGELADVAFGWPSELTGSTYRGLNTVYGVSTSSQPGEHPGPYKWTKRNLGVQPGVYNICWCNEAGDSKCTSGVDFTVRAGAFNLIGPYTPTSAHNCWRGRACTIAEYGQLFDLNDTVHVCEDRSFYSPYPWDKVASVTGVEIKNQSHDATSLIHVLIESPMVAPPAGYSICWNSGRTIELGINVSNEGATLAHVKLIGPHLNIDPMYCQLGAVCNFKLEVINPSKTVPNELLAKALAGSLHTTDWESDTQSVDGVRRPSTVMLKGPVLGAVDTLDVSKACANYPEASDALGSISKAVVNTTEVTVTGVDAVYSMSDPYLNAMPGKILLICWCIGIPQSCEHASEDFLALSGVLILRGPWGDSRNALQKCAIGSACSVRVTGYELSPHDKLVIKPGRNSCTDPLTEGAPGFYSDLCTGAGDACWSRDRPDLMLPLGNCPDSCIKGLADYPAEQLVISEDSLNTVNSGIIYKWSGDDLLADSGDYSMCWCGSQSGCTGPEDFTYYINDLHVEDKPAISAYTCVSAQECFFDVDGGQFVGTEIAVKRGSSCRRDGETLTVTRGEEKPFSTRQTRFSLGKLDQAGSEGELLVCWCGNSEGCSDHRVDIGALTVEGPLHDDSRNDFACVLGQWCIMPGLDDQDKVGNVMLGSKYTTKDGRSNGPIVGVSLKAGDYFNIAPPGMCGRVPSNFFPQPSSNANVAARSEPMTDTLQVSWITENRNLSQSVLMDAHPGNYELCWCRPQISKSRTCSTYSEYFSYKAAKLHIAGPEPGQILQCVRGRNCEIILTGFGLHTGDIVEAVSFLGTCGGEKPSGHAVGTGFTITLHATFGLADLTSDGDYVNVLTHAPGVYKICWCQPIYSTEQSCTANVEAGSVQVKGPLFQDESAKMGDEFTVANVRGIGLDSPFEYMMLLFECGKPNNDGHPHVWAKKDDKEAYQLGQLTADRIYPNVYRKCWCRVDVAAGSSCGDDPRSYHTPFGLATIFCKEGTERKRVVSEPAQGSRQVSTQTNGQNKGINGRNRAAVGRSLRTDVSLPGASGTYYECVPCRRGFYRADAAPGMPCKACPPNSNTQVTGSINFEDCICDPGFYWNAEEAECKTCGFEMTAIWLKATMSIARQGQSNSKTPQSSSKTDENSKQQDASPEASKNSQKQSANETDNVDAEMDSGKAADAEAAIDARTRKNALLYKQLYCDGHGFGTDGKWFASVPQECPANSRSNPYFANDAKPQNIQACQCMEGYEPDVTNVSFVKSFVCSSCASGKFKATGTNERCQSCQDIIVGSITAQMASTTSKHCKCPAGTYKRSWLDAARKPFCDVCPKGFFCDGMYNSFNELATGKVRCMEGATTLDSGMSRSMDCICSVGYICSEYYEDGCRACTRCAAGRYKGNVGNTPVGDSKATECVDECPGNMTSAAGSGSKENCVCSPGYIRKDVGDLESPCIREMAGESIQIGETEFPVPAVAGNQFLKGMQRPRDLEAAARSFTQKLKSELGITTQTSCGQGELNDDGVFKASCEDVELTFTLDAAKDAADTTSRRLTSTTDGVGVAWVLKTSEAQARLAAQTFKADELVQLLQTDQENFGGLIGVDVLAATTVTTVNATCPPNTAKPSGAPFFSVEESCKCQAGFRAIMKQGKLQRCEQCPVNTYKSVASNEQCMQCDPNMAGMRITGRTPSGRVKLGNTMLKDCLCKPGYFAYCSFAEIMMDGANGTDLCCAECPAGQFCPFDLSDDPVDCLVGSATKRNGSSLPRACDCLPGYGRQNGDDSPCVPCPRRTYKNLHKDDTCISCPQEQMDSEKGSSDVRACFCLEEYYYNGKPPNGRCEPCSADRGLTCPGHFYNNTQEHVQPLAKPDYFLTGNARSLQCRVDENGDSMCLGGREKQEWAGPCLKDCNCIEGMDGFLCQNCKEGWTRDMYTQSCQECPGPSDLYVNLVSSVFVSALLSAFVYHGLTYMALRASHGTLSMHSTLLRLWQSWAVSMSVLRTLDFTQIEMFSWNAQAEQMKALEDMNQGGAGNGTDTRGIYGPAVDIRVPWPDWFQGLANVVYGFDNLLISIGSSTMTAECFAEYMMPQQAETMKYTIAVLFHVCYPLVVLLVMIVMDLVLIYIVYPPMERINFFTPSDPDELKRFVFRLAKPTLLEALRDDELGMLEEDRERVVGYMDQIMSKMTITSVADMKLLVGHPREGLAALSDLFAADKKTCLFTSDDVSLAKYSCLLMSRKIVVKDLEKILDNAENKRHYLWSTADKLRTSAEDVASDELFDNMVNTADFFAVDEFLTILMAPTSLIEKLISSGKEPEKLQLCFIKPTFASKAHSEYEMDEDLADRCWNTIFDALRKIGPEEFLNILMREKPLDNLLEQCELKAPCYSAFLIIAFHNVQLSAWLRENFTEYADDIWNVLLDMLEIEDESTQGDVNVRVPMVQVAAQDLFDALKKGFSEALNLLACKAGAGPGGYFLAKLKQPALKQYLENIQDTDGNNAYTVEEVQGVMKEILQYCYNADFAEVQRLTKGSSPASLVEVVSRLDKDDPMIHPKDKNKPPPRGGMGAFAVVAGFSGSVTSAEGDASRSLQVMQKHNDSLDYPVFGFFRKSPSARQFFSDFRPLFWIALYSMWYETTKRLLLMLHCISNIEELEDGSKKIKLRWAKQMNMVCYEGTHFTVAMIAIIGLCVWSAGLLLVLLFLIRRHKKDMQTDPQLMRRYSYFVSGYEKEWCSWDISVKKLDNLATIVITYTSIASDIKAKILLYAVLAMSCWTIHSLYMPFDDRKNMLCDRVENMGLCVRFLIFGALALLLVFSEVVNMTVATLIAILALGACFYFLFFLFSQTLCEFFADLSSDQIEGTIISEERLDVLREMEDNDEKVGCFSKFCGKFCGVLTMIFRRFVSPILRLGLWTAKKLAAVRQELEDEALCFMPAPNFAKRVQPRVAKGGGTFSRCRHRLKEMYFFQGDKTQREFIVNVLSNFVGHLICNLEEERIELGSGLLGTFLAVCAAYKQASKSYRLQDLQPHDIMDVVKKHFDSSAQAAHDYLHVDDDGQDAFASVEVDEEQEELEARKKAVVRLTGEDLNEVFMWLQKLTGDELSDLLERARISASDADQKEAWRAGTYHSEKSIGLSSVTMSQRSLPNLRQASIRKTGTQQSRPVGFETEVPAFADEFNQWDQFGSEEDAGADAWKRKAMEMMGWQGLIGAAGDGDANSSSKREEVSENKPLTGLRTIV